MVHHELETAFTMDTSSIKFGPGSTREVGFEIARLGAKRVAVVTDPRMAQLQPVAVVLESVRAEGGRRSAVRRGGGGAYGRVVQGGH